MSQTNQEYDQIVSKCKRLFVQKTKDYGTAWRILRPTSLTDQILIKARRIRQIQENGVQKIGDTVNSELIGIVNYAVLALVQLSLPKDFPIELEVEKAVELFEAQVFVTKNLMLEKNHDYGEVWREMRVSSMVDLILMKLLRIKQIENNAGKTIVSEGLDANYQDIVNYAIFCLIKIENNQ